MDVFNVLTCSGINDPKRRPSRQLHDGANLLRSGGNLSHFKIKIRAVKSADDLRRALNAELCEDIPADRRCGCCREREYRRRLEIADCAAQAQIIGTKVMSPKGDAVRFINRKQADVRAGETCAKFLVLKTLRGNVQQLDAAGDRLLEPASLLLARNRAVD